MRVAIVADDLTGALDVCAPLAARGLVCHVATHPDGLEQAIACDGDVVCVNTATRETSSEAARATVRGVAERLAGANPAIRFKKIDSRLKGHVAVEARTCLDAFGRQRAIVAPAVPAQGRRVVGGRVEGTGLPAPLRIADVLGNALPYEAPDSLDASDLSRIARENRDDTLLVGASGLAAGLAEVLAPSGGGASAPVAGPFLAAIGSHDPITLAQVARATGSPGVHHLVTHDGTLHAEATRHPATLVQAVVPADARATAMAAFGVSVAAVLRRGAFGSALLCGGETAQTVLAALGVRCLEVLGEALPGIPVARARIGDHLPAILTKSGGFGTPDDILRLAEIARKSMHPTHRSIAGEQA